MSRANVLVSWLVERVTVEVGGVLHRVDFTSFCGKDRAVHIVKQRERVWYLLRLARFAGLSFSYPEIARACGFVVDRKLAKLKVPDWYLAHTR